MRFLITAGVSVNSITVYETIPNPAIRDQLEEIARRLVSVHLKNTFPYNAILGSVQGTLHSTPGQNCSIEHHLNSSGRHPTMLQLMSEY